MEALATLGLVGNIVQFLDFTTKILSSAHNIHKSNSPTPNDFTDIELTCQDILAIVSHIETQSSTSTTEPVRNTLEALRIRCCQTGKEIIEILSKLSIKGKLTRWKSLKQALATEWKSGKLQKIQERLVSIRDEIHFHLTHSLGLSLDTIAKGQLDRFVDLQGQIGRIGSSLATHQTKAQKDIEDCVSTHHDQGLHQIQGYLDTKHQSLVGLTVKSWDKTSSGLSSILRHQNDIHQSLSDLKSGGIRINGDILRSAVKHQIEQAFFQALGTRSFDEVVTNGLQDIQAQLKRSMMEMNVELRQEIVSTNLVSNSTSIRESDDATTGNNSSGSDGSGTSSQDTLLGQPNSLHRQISSLIDDLPSILTQATRANVKELHVVAQRFQNDTARVVLKMKKAQRTLLRVQRDVQQISRRAHRPQESKKNDRKRSLDEDRTAEGVVPPPKRICSQGETSSVNSAESNEVVSLRRGPEADKDIAPSITDVIMLDAASCGVYTDVEEKPMTVELDPLFERPVWENGLPYHSFGEVTYMLPCGGDDWLYKEDLLHHVILLLLRKNLLLGSTPKPSDRILDIGTGTGIWALEVGDECPLTNVIGIDLYPSQPRWVPPNVRYIIDDFTDMYHMPFACPQYYCDIIHVRHAVMAVDDWDEFLRMVQRELRPGGTAEFQEIRWYPWTQSDETLKPAYGALAECLHTLAAAFNALGIDLDAARHIRPRLEREGWECVREEVIRLPLGSWPTDTREKEIGEYFNFWLHGVALGLCNRVLRLGLKYTTDSVRGWVKRFRRALRDSTRMGICFQFYVVYGRKPSAGRAIEYVGNG